MIARMQKAMKEKDGGFTLVELIVVVVIIGVLAAIAVPVFLGQANKAKVNADVAALSNAKIATASYLAETTPGSNTTFNNTALADYGMPATPAMTVTYTAAVAATNSAAAVPATYSIAITSGGQSGKNCTVANPGAAPSCS